MKHIAKYVVLLGLFLYTSTAFSQIYFGEEAPNKSKPGSIHTGGDNGGHYDEPDAPIDQWTVYLLLAGIGAGYYSLKRRKKHTAIPFWNN